MSKTTPKRDLKRELRNLYSGKVGAIQAVEPGTQRYLCWDGQGDPNTSPLYQRAVEGLFSVSYHLKFAARETHRVDYAVMPLEGLWWSDNPDDFLQGSKANWQWTMMILQPAFITLDEVQVAKTAVAKKRGLDLQPLELREHHEGPTAQTLHVGPFSEEGPVIARLHQWIAGQGRRLTGKHHEIYLTDIRRADPARWKTILRQPFA